MTAYYAATLIRQNGEIFACTEDYHAENPNIFHHHEMLDHLNRTFATKGAWQNADGKRLDFGRYTSKQVAQMMIDGLGKVEELGIEGEMPVYMRLIPLQEKGGLTQSMAEKLIDCNGIQAVVSHRDPVFQEREQAIGLKCATSLLLYANYDNELNGMRLFQV
jgi:hypothetical protein